MDELFDIWYLGVKEMESRMRDTEKKMDSMKEMSGEDQVEECLRQVCILQYSITETQTSPKDP